MASVADFKGRIEEEFNKLAGDVKSLFEDIDNQMDILSRLAKTIEASQQIAIKTLSNLITAEHGDISNALLESLGAVDDDAEDYAEQELGFFIYWINTDQGQASKLADTDGVVATSLDVLRAVLPNSAITDEQINILFNGTETDPRLPVWVSGDGTVWGISKYEQLDIGWLVAVFNLIGTLLLDGIFKPFPTRPKLETVKLNANKNGTVKIAIIGDWGGGNDLAKEVMQTVNELKPDYIIHLGDTYYAGTDKHGIPANEEKNFLVDFWKQYGPANNGQCFTLNSNHEMYSGARGYFNDALPDPMFSAQKNFSYFTLEFGQWLIAGFDSAYYAPLPTYLTGGMGGDEDPQYGFLQEVAAQGKKTILMCHHNPIAYTGAASSKKSKQGKFLAEVTNVITPDYWYWGHEHLAAVYNDTSATKNIKARCVGNGCIPIGTPTDFIGNSTISWFANSPLDVPSEHVFPSAATRVKNGFSMITLTQGGIKEDFYDAGNTTPVHSI